ncbi:hypothetical protein SAMN02746073_2252 [Legionella jamestowniensis DSM 19215]|uniref:Coiled-coil protein n=2 Tax=Legionella jamestowniensis TaxID=455 RepID=A0A0W0UHA5_9GAMM|nr:coiled-coil protein [Legionella jamestowniensis]SFL85082.1 hypothetical protein SAMN02746073_2252 [Legionella jamestowniensis DSM 19215]
MQGRNISRFITPIMSKINQIKHNFFNKSSNSFKGFLFTDNDFDLKQLNWEFLSVYQLVISNKEILKRNREIILYLNYLCEILIQYYQLDYVEKDLERLLLKKREIEQFIKEEAANGNSNTMVHCPVILVGPRRSASDYTSVLTSSSRFREHTSALITNRSYWNYSRSLANYLIIYLQGNGFASLMLEVNEKLGIHYSVLDFVKLLDKPQKFLRFSSVVLYIFRFTTNLAVLLKHVINAAVSNKLSSTKVLAQEIEKRGFTMANDMVWGVVNLLSNYNRFFQLSSLIIAQINLAFLVFDLGLFIVHWLFDRSDYVRRIEELKQQKKNINSAFEQAVIARQLDILHDEWRVECAYYEFNIIAASILAIAFAATFIYFGPFALGVLSALSMLGNAFYNTGDEYKKYKKASVSLKREKINGEILKDEGHYKLFNQLHIECLQANRFFWKTLIFNTVATSFIITAAAISFPIASMLTVSYVIYRFFDSYQQMHREKDSKKCSYEVYRLFKVNNLENPIVSLKEKPVESCNSVIYS